MAKYYTFLKEGNYLRLEDNAFLVKYSRSRKKLIKFLENFSHNGQTLCRHWRSIGAIVKDEKPSWYKYRDIL